MDNYRATWAECIHFTRLLHNSEKSICSFDRHNLQHTHQLALLQRLIHSIIHTFIHLVLVVCSLIKKFPHSFIHLPIWYSMSLAVTNDTKFKFKL